MGIAVFLSIACFEIISGAIEQIVRGTQEVDISPSVLWMLVIVLGINIFVAFYERRIGKKSAVVF